MFALGDRLHKTIAEVEEISFNELQEWMIFYDLQAQERKKNG